MSNINCFAALQIDTGKELFDELCSKLDDSNFFKLLEEKFRLNSIQLETISMSPFVINEFNLEEALVRDYYGGAIVIDNVNFDTDAAKRIKLIKLSTEDGSKISGSIIYLDNTEEKVHIY